MIKRGSEKRWRSNLDLPVHFPQNFLFKSTKAVRKDGDHEKHICYEKQSSGWIRVMPAMAFAIGSQIGIPIERCDCCAKSTVQWMPGLTKVCPVDGRENKPAWRSFEHRL
jgi:hypothetical protein